MGETVVMEFAPEHRRDHLRILEALLFAASEPLDLDSLRDRLPDDADIEALLKDLTAAYANRGVNLVHVAGGYAFRTASDLAYLMRRYAVEPKKLSRVAMETLAIIAYHQPVTRAEIEEVRGVSTSRGTLDTLLETGWIRMRGRRRSPGRPVTYGTTGRFLEQFGLDSVKDLPGLDELKGAGLLDSRLPPNFRVPVPNDDEDLTEDEDPLDPDDLFELEADGDDEDALDAAFRSEEAD
ncbi:MAG: SMC-Scp complex subunit ScpB [Rhodobiaceae bacterium]|nr:SMC-Scp complex subunit ScpB [Rhodobiaceae bacterium]